MKVVDTDAFMDMPLSSQALYLHLLVRADDDGFIASPRKIMRMIACQEDDLKVLISKRFVLPFDSGVCVIKHWRIHNLIRGDRYSGTQWTKEKEQLVVDERTKKYSLLAKNKDETEYVIPNGNQMAPQVRLGKVRLGKDSIDSEAYASHGLSQLIPEVIKAFEDVNPVAKNWYGNKTQRSACERLIEQHGLETVLNVVRILPQTNKMKYVPTITTPLQLENKWSALEASLAKHDGETSNVLTI